MPLLTEVIKEMQIEDAVDQLAVVVEGILSEINVQCGPRGEKGNRGDQGPQGPPGRDADITEIVRAARRVMQDELQSAKNALREIVVAELKQSSVIDSSGRAMLIPGPQGVGKDGRDGVDGKDSTVPGPKGDVGVGKPGQNGVDGKPGQNGVDGKSIVGPAGQDSIVPGPQGACGEPGKNGVTLEEVEKLIQEIIGNSGDIVLQKFVALKKEIGLIANDRRYQRVHSVREEIAERLQQHLT